MLKSERFLKFILWITCILVTLGLLTVDGDTMFLMVSLPFLFLLWYLSSDIRYLYCLIGFAICLIGKKYCFYLEDYHSIPIEQTVYVLIFLLTIACGLFFYRIILRSNASAKPFVIQSTRKLLPFSRIDFGILLFLCLIYGIPAFWNLGSKEAPVTEMPFYCKESITLELPADFEFNYPSFPTLNWYAKDFEAFDLLVRVSADGENWDIVAQVEVGQQFSWCRLNLSTGEKLSPGGQYHLTPYVDLDQERILEYLSEDTEFLQYPSPDAASSRQFRYLQLINDSRDASLAELVLQDSDGTVIMPVNSAEYPELFDETGLFPETIDHRYGSYFDEIYYTRTVHEFINGSKTYEITHPPLGKILMIPGVLLFGTSPFGFRFSGVVLGILMLPVLYLLARDLFQNRLYGALAAFVFAFDFMHFTQTRITTLDTSITFFTILMFYWMNRYLQMSFYDSSLRKMFLPLGLCGISFGLGVACKWTGMYAGVGLAVLFFYSLYLRWQEYHFAKADPNGENNGISHQVILTRFLPCTIRTILFCIPFFLILPFLIYLLSFLPFVDEAGSGLWTRMWNNVQFSLNFHSNLDSDHPYASPWYQWPTIVRPVYYFAKTLPGSMRQGISAFGNPLVWWTGIPAFLYLLYRILKRGDRNAEFLCIAYLSCYLPWCFVSRCTFAYHYFPSVPFVVCMILYCFVLADRLSGTPEHQSDRSTFRLSKAAVAALLYSLAVLGLFVLFYPVLSGTPVSAEYVSTYLRWFDTWSLTP